MAYKNTVAIIGASGTVGAFIAKAISAHYRLLLMDKETAGLAILRDEILKENKTAEIETVHCCKDASWEADIIVITVAESEKPSTALTMKEVATCKTVINFTSSENAEIDLQRLLPHSRAVNVFGLADLVEGEINRLSIEGDSDEAVKTAVEMIQIAGLHYNVYKKEYEHENREK